MSRRHRLVLLLALLLVVPFAACGTAEEPVENAADPAAEEPAEQPAEEPETPPVQEEEPPPPQEPELVGNIRLSNEALEWDAENTTTEVAPYTWSVRVNNDTTATLDITVTFQLLDENDGVIKTETGTIRLQPAQSGTVRENGSIPYDRANSVYGYAATWDYEIVQS